MREIKEGTKVYYTTPYGKKSNGIVKSFNDDKTIAFVVYHCGNDWKNYRDYTGAATNIDEIEYGWVDENGILMKEFCDHHYTPTNAKMEISNPKTMSMVWRHNRLINNA